MIELLEALNFFSDFAIVSQCLLLCVWKNTEIVSNIEKGIISFTTLLKVYYGICNFMKQ